MATLEEVLVPLYLHHRYQVEAAASTVGGVYYTYALRGDGSEPVRFASGAEQRAAAQALIATLKPSELTLPADLLKKIPPRPSGYGRTRELFPRYTGQMFDAITPAVVAADMTVGFLLDEARAARVVEQHALDPTLPGLEWLLDELIGGTFKAQTANAYEAEISRAVQRIVMEHVMTLADGAEMPQVRALATARLLEWKAVNVQPTDAAAAHRAAMAEDIRRFLDRPLAATTRAEIPAAPPGAPIGEPGMDWLRRIEPPCSVWDDR
jgi:hypothetical protein